MKVKKSETIKNLKAMIHVKEGISEDICDLFFAGDRLEAGRLVDYGIRNNSTLHFLHQNLSEMKLFVKIPTNQTATVVEAMPYHTVQNIKSMIQVKEGIQSDQFTLVYDGKLLKEDTATMTSMNIKSESIIHLVFCPKEILSIFVKAATGEIVNLEVKHSFAIRDVKAIVGSVVGVSAADHIMIYEGKKLEDSKTLAFYDMKDECLLEMFPSSIQIFVRTPIEEIMRLEVEVLIAVRDVKEIVANIIDLSLGNQDLFYAGTKLEACKTLASYGIKNNYVVDVLPSPFQIFVKTWGGKTITLDVQPYNTVQDVKVKLFDKLQTPLHLQSIVFDGKRLFENHVLASYNIQKHSTLHMVLAPSSRIIELPLIFIDPSISLSISISEVKEMAKVKFQAAVKELLVDQVALQDDRTLADYGMDLSEKVVLVF